MGLIALMLAAPARQATARHGWLGEGIGVDAVETRRFVDVGSGRWR